MILGLTGTNGAGKGSVVDYLVREKGFEHYSVREYVVGIVLERELELNRTNIGNVATSLRQEHSPDFFTNTFMAIAKEEGIENYIIESIRTESEAANLKEHGGFVIAIDAPIEIRYERITGRGSVTDKVSFDDFRDQELAEYHSKDLSDPTQMNFKAVMDNANYTLVNDGTLEEFHTKIEVMLKELTG